MREGREYRCPQCGTTSPVGVSCSNCKVDMIDENGNPPLKPMPKIPSFVVSPWTLGGAALGFLGYAIISAIEPGHSALTVLLVGLFVMTAGAVSLFWGVTQPRRVLRSGQARRRTWATAALRRATEVTAIGKTADGPARVRGKVKVLRPVHAPRTGEPVAAFETDDEREGGRFAIVDETGVAVVDDDCFELWSWDSSGSPGPCGGQIPDGAMVEAFGQAVRRPTADVVGLATDPHYREAAQALVFEGKPDAPVRLLPVR